MERHVRPGENGLFSTWFESHMENDKIVLFPYTIHLDKVQMTQRFKCKKKMKPYKY